LNCVTRFFFPSAGIGERGESTERAVSPSRRGGSLDARGGAAFAREEEEEEEEEEEASELPDVRLFFYAFAFFSSTSSHATRRKKGVRFWFLETRPERHRARAVSPRGRTHRFCRSFPALAAGEGLGTRACSTTDAHFTNHSLRI
jgi:hypothetical protein